MKSKSEGWKEWDKRQIASLRIIAFILFGTLGLGGLFISPPIGIVFIVVGILFDQTTKKLGQWYINRKYE